MRRPYEPIRDSTDSFKTGNIPDLNDDFAPLDYSGGKQYYSNQKYSVKV